MVLWPIRVHVPFELFYNFSYQICVLCSHRNYRYLGINYVQETSLSCGIISNTDSSVQLAPFD